MREKLSIPVIRFFREHHSIRTSKDGKLPDEDSMKLIDFPDVHIHIADKDNGEISEKPGTYGLIRCGRPLLGGSVPFVDETLLSE